MTALYILMVIICVLLALIVLIQNPKGGGLDSSFGSAAQLGGVQKTTDFLEKSTWTLIIALVVLCLASTTLTSTGDSNLVDDKFRDEAPVQQAPQQAPAQEQPAN